jgi:hypothetical protein
MHIFKAYDLSFAEFIEFLDVIISFQEREIKDTNYNFLLNFDKRK